jgi:hypothetical protein
MVSNLQLRNGALTGVLAGKPLFCFLRSALGAAPPAGQYVIRSVQDSIYGPVMVLVSGGAGKAVMTDGGITAYKDGEDGVNRPGGGLVSDDWEARPGGSTFIVCGAPLPGRNCLVVTAGLSDLMDALKTVGSALITVG